MLTALKVSRDNKYNFPPVSFESFMVRVIMMHRLFLYFIEASYQGLSYMALVKLSLCVKKIITFCQLQIFIWKFST